LLSLGIWNSNKTTFAQNQSANQATLQSTKLRFVSGAEGRFLVKVRRLLLLLAYKRRRINTHRNVSPSAVVAVLKLVAIYYYGTAVFPEIYPPLGFGIQNSEF